MTSEAIPLDIVTEAVHPDEPCYGLWERARDGRIEMLLFVARGDAIAKFVLDVGPVENFPDWTPTIVDSEGEDTVGQLLDFAERQRFSTFAREHREKVAAESTLVADINRQRAIWREVVRNRTVMGPYQSRQANDYPSQFAARLLRDERARRTGRSRFAI